MGEAESHRVFTLNVLPIVEDPEKPGAFCSRKNLLQKNRVPTNLDYLMAFGTAATCYVPAEQRRGGKEPAQRKSFRGVILGYTEGMPAYRVWDIEYRVIKKVSYNFTICHEGYYPFKEKSNWPPGSDLEPIYFSPRYADVISRSELEKFGFDEEDLAEVLVDERFPMMGDQSSPRSPLSVIENALESKTSSVAPSESLSTTSPAQYQTKAQCLTDSQGNQLRSDLRASSNTETCIDVGERVGLASGPVDRPTHKPALLPS